MAFDRSKSWWDRSWALRVFKYHHSELNRNYWTSAVMHLLSARALSGVAENIQTAVHLNLSGPDVRRPPRTVGEFKTALVDTGNWTRLNATMAVASYLEIYVSTVVTLAVESDPGTLIGLRGKVDGTILLKALPGYSRRADALSAVKGTWHERLIYMESLFGLAPPSLAASVNELDKLRRFRNGVGHAFGRDLAATSDGVELVASPALRVSEERLKKWLDGVDKAATDIDKWLMPYIGAYELLRLYHDWPKRREGHWGDHARAFKKSVGAVAGSNGPGLDYYREAISHYRNAPTA